MDSTVPTAQPLFPPRSAGIVPLTQRGKERSLTWPRLPPATRWSCWARQGRTGPSLLGGNWVCQNQVSGQELDRTRSLSLASLHCLPTPAGSKHLTKPHRPAEKGTLLPRGPAPPACAGANWNRNRPSSSGCPEKVLSPLQPCAPFPRGGLGAPAIIPRCSAAFQKLLTKCKKKTKHVCVSVFAKYEVLEEQTRWLGCGVALLLTHLSTHSRRHVLFPSKYRPLLSKAQMLSSSLKELHYFHQDFFVSHKSLRNIVVLFLAFLLIFKLVGWYTMWLNFHICLYSWNKYLKNSHKNIS